VQPLEAIVQTIQQERDRMIEAGLPGAFVYGEEANGASRFFTAGFAALFHEGFNAEGPQPSARHSRPASNHEAGCSA
jgi:hypothetical protein